MKAKTGGFITTITRQSTEWEVFFTVKFHSFGNSTSDWQRILRITNNNGNKTSYGIRYPLVTMQRSMIQISSAVNSKYDHKYLQRDMILDKAYNIKIGQYYIGNGQYNYRIEINGQKVHSVINNDVKQFYDMKFYLLEKTGSDCDVTDLKFINFL